MKKSKRLMRIAALFLALALLWAVSALPAARGQETSPAASPLKTAGEAESGEVLAVEALEEPEDSLEDLRTIRAADVAAENLDAARWAVYRDLLPLEEAGCFDGERPATRAEAVQALYRLSGILVRVDACPWPDVPEAFQDAVAWAAAEGIVGGYGNGMFGPNDNITREQLAVMLWRYAGSPAATDKELHFTDADKASGYALEALRWAVENGILNGYGDGRLGPQGLATRAQVAQMLMNFLKDE